MEARISDSAASEIAELIVQALSALCVPSVTHTVRREREVSLVTVVAKYGTVGARQVLEALHDAGAHDNLANVLMDMRALRFRSLERRYTRGLETFSVRIERLREYALKLRRDVLSILDRAQLDYASEGAADGLPACDPDALVEALRSVEQGLNPADPAIAEDLVTETVQAYTQWSELHGRLLDLVKLYENTVAQ